MSGHLGQGLEWAVTQARRAIHDDDVERLEQLLAEYPAMLAWQGADEDGKGGLLGIATGAYGDAGDPERERWFTRAACAELLIDAGAVVLPSACAGLLESRARGLLQLFRRKGLLPRTLEFHAALGDLEAVRASLDGGGNDPAAVDRAFLCACRFEHEAVASLLLERAIALDPELGARVDGSVGRLAFVERFSAEAPAHAPEHAPAVGAWKAFVMGQITRALRAGDLPAFVGGLQREPWLLGEACAWFQARLVDVATLNDRGEFIAALLDLDSGLLRTRPPPRSQALEIAFTYANTHLVPLLTRIWTLPADLPHAAGMGDLAQVQRWFDATGAFQPGALDAHYPCNDPRARGHLQWDPPAAQQILDVALAFAVINRRFDVADFLLEHGADIDTRWNSHEPASILHHLVFYGSTESMRFLIERGIDMTIEDYRWKSTAQGWALHGKKDEELARWLADAERQRGPRR